MKEEKQLTLSFKQVGIISFLIGVLVTALITSLVVDFTGETPRQERATDTGNDKEIEPSPSASTRDLELESEPQIGEGEASVRIVYWSNFNCKYCKEFERNILPQIREEFIEKGEVQLFFKNYPYNGSSTASMSSRCVWKQTRDTETYLNWRESLYEILGRKNTTDAEKGELLKLSANYSTINREKLGICLNNSEDEVRKDFAKGKELNIFGRPGFIIYNKDEVVGQKLIGTRPYRAFKGSIKLRMR